MACGVICPECGRQRGAEPGNCRSLADCLTDVRKQLREWRSGKRHILRRVYWGDKYVSHIDFTRRKNAHGYARMLREDYGVSAKVTRVTAGPAKPKEAK